MNFIQEQKQHILEENNTAQRDLLDFLDHLLPNVDELIFKDPLNGDLDFSILKECNFQKITAIVFKKGGITSIKNIPNSLVRLICNDNLLTNLDNLPESLVELELNGNGLSESTTDFTGLKNLKTLHISENHFTELENLPSSLENLYCDSNFLKRISLEGIKQLKVLHCSNNPLVSIQQFPDTLQDFIMDNSTTVEIEKRSDMGIKRREQVESFDYDESLNTYFELKNAYETKLYKSKRAIYYKAINKKMAMKNVRLVRPQCINCSRPVGTIFANTERKFTAICGDKVSPCNLNILIYAGHFNNILKEISVYDQAVNKNKENIIRQKLDTLFNYVDEKTSVERFKSEFEKYNENNILLNDLKTTYTDIHFSTVRNEKRKVKNADIFKINERIQNSLSKFKSTDNISILKDTMKIYKDELIPEIKNLRMIEHETMEMDDGVLFQREYRIAKNDFTFGELPRVIKFMRNIND